MAVCGQCGAAPTAGSGSHCAYCGSVLSREAVLLQAESVDSMTQAIEEAPHVRPHRLSALTLDMPPGGEAYVNFWKFWTGLTGVIFVAMLCIANVIPIWLVPLGFVILGVKRMKAGQRSIRRFQEAPLLRQAVRVLGERTHVSGGGRRRATHTTYHVTLESADGSRSEYHTDGELIGLVAEGDVGVAFTRDVHLLDFVRVG